MNARNLNEDNSAPVYSASIPESLHPLAALAMREAGAQGYALFRAGGEDGMIRIGGSGAAIPASAAEADPRVCVLRFPLRCGGRTTGEVAFAFEGRVPTPAARTRLCRMAAAIGQIWQLRETSFALAAKAARIGELEASLADSKIATRARGFLSDTGAGKDVVEISARHVQTVLGRSESEALLDRRLAELEAELRERDLAAAAKALLQVSDGMTEDAAHLRLRLLSRQTRRPLREVALEVIAASRGRPAPRTGHSA